MSGARTFYNVAQDGTCLEDPVEIEVIFKLYKIPPLPYLVARFVHKFQGEHFEARGSPFEAFIQFHRGKSAKDCEAWLHEEAARAVLNAW